MKFNKLALTTSLLLAIGFTAPSFAETATTATDAVKEAPAAADCTSQADFDAMSDADKATLTKPICETGTDAAAPTDAEAPVAK